MLVIVKNGPDTPEGERGMTVARDAVANVLLLQNGVYFAQGERLEGFHGTVYVHDGDKMLRGLKDEELVEGIEKSDVDALIDLLAREDKVVGMF